MFGCFNDLVQIKDDAAVHDQRAHNERPVFEKDSFNEEDTLHDHNACCENGGKVCTGVRVVDDPPLAKVFKREHCIPNDEREAPSTLRVPEVFFMSEKAVHNRRSSYDEHNA